MQRRNPPAPPTAGEFLDDAINQLYESLDPDDTMGADDTTYDNGLPGDSYYSY